MIALSGFSSSVVAIISGICAWKSPPTRGRLASESVDFKKLSRREDRRVVFMLSIILLLMDRGPEERVFRTDDGGVELPSSLVSCSDEEETLSALA